MNNRLKAAALLGFAAVMLRCSDGVVGTGDETVVRSARVYTAELKPAANVNVRVYGVGDTTRIPSYETVTDAEGEYSIDIANGMYNILIGDEDQGAFQDSVTFSRSYSTLADDTLGTTGVLRGKVLVEPVHSPQTVTVQVVGTNKFSNVSPDGGFLIPGLPAGEYVLRGTGTVAEYTPTYSGFVISPADSDTTAITLAMIYTGIPVVRNFRLSYDSLLNVVSLTWDTVSYFLLQDFIIYSAQGEGAGFSEFGTTASCGYSFNGGDAGTRSDFRVAVRSKTLDIGPAIESQSVVYQQPVAMRLIDTAVCQLGVPYTLSAPVTDEKGASVAYEWDIGATGTYTAGSGSDTTFTVTGEFFEKRECRVRVTVDGRIALADTVTLTFVAAWEMIAEPVVAGMDWYDAVEHDGRVFLFCGGWSQTSEHVRSSSDCIEWTTLSDGPGIPSVHSRPVVFNGMFCIADKNGFLWTSSDAVTWEKGAAPVCSTWVEFGSAMGPARGLYAPKLFTVGERLYLQSNSGTVQSDSVFATENLTDWSVAELTVGTNVADFRSSGETTVLCGCSFYAFNYWIGTLTNDSVSYLPEPFPLGTGLMDAGEYSDLFSWSAVEYQLEFYNGYYLFSGNANPLWVYTPGSGKWSEITLPATMVARGGQCALFTFNEALFVISESGVFRLVK
ncbi:MAG: hypothetical protein JW863_11225 [Chitinispirillaceae bacterium]|nr:hypothetical protein [Chitinispirillaceae bacterium]